MRDVLIDGRSWCQKSCRCLAALFGIVLLGIGVLGLVAGLVTGPGASSVFGIKPAAAAEATLDPGTPDAGPLVTVAAFHAALRAGDANGVVRLLDKDVLIFEGGRVQRSLAEYQEHHLQADMEASRSLTRKILSTHVFAVGRQAVVATQSRTTGRFRDRDYDLIGTETAVLARADNGSWRITHLHWSSRPADG